jgi:hypothetical protein
MLRRSRWCLNFRQGRQPSRLSALLSSVQDLDAGLGLGADAGLRYDVGHEAGSSSPWAQVNLQASYTAILSDTPVPDTANVVGTEAAFQYTPCRSLKRLY